MNNNKQNNRSRPSDSSSDLSWVAFCYVANELDAEARRQFEIRLERDQTARDAVVQAFDNTRLLDLAVDSIDDQVPLPTYELASQETRSPQSQTTARSKSIWPKALLGIAAAGLLALVFSQLPPEQPGSKIALNTDNSSSTVKFTKASMALAETWADSDWQADLQIEIADIETSLTLDTQSGSPPKLLDDTDQDDWMTATLIDMAEAPSSSTSGS